MQNKPNFRKAQMKLNSHSTKDYENKLMIGTPGKQTQSPAPAGDINPIKPNLFSEGAGGVK